MNERVRLQYEGIADSFGKLLGTLIYIEDEIITLKKRLADLERLHASDGK